MAKLGDEPGISLLQDRDNLHKLTSGLADGADLEGWLERRLRGLFNEPTSLIEQALSFYQG